MSIPPLPDGEIHIWSADRRDTDLGHARQVLDPGELARADRRGEPGRSRYLASHLAFRTILGGYLGRAADTLRFDRRCAHCGDPGHGKPAADPALDASLSHSGERFLIAVCRSPGRVGVDIERIRPGVDWAAISALRSLPRLAGFQEWTRTEAVLKAAGVGLAGRARPWPGAPDGGTHPAGRRFLVDGSPEPWYAHDLGCPPGHVGAVATGLPDATVRMFTWSG
ncbi:4'-phosphopantetheinyl transferase [Thermomonospora echinospora]|uniref:4'-phosphopantetheinyl transferase n=1 Tax=Thermomonospora echinospora TaxID=1992 RepID=A0A1H5VG07_9ACTN|nr:hypothetical protein [Thermomonospora echinospora]SEF85748.1 4'-phosphopantetheinyl transferase [Thermomonospora echinospora]